MFQPLAAEAGEHGEVQIIRQPGCSPAEVRDAADETEPNAARDQAGLHAGTRLQQRPHRRGARAKIRCCATSPEDGVTGSARTRAQSASSSSSATRHRSTHSSSAARTRVKAGPAARHCDIHACACAFVGLIRSRKVPLRCFVRLASRRSAGGVRRSRRPESEAERPLLQTVMRAPRQSAKLGPHGLVHELISAAKERVRLTVSVRAPAPPLVAIHEGSRLSRPQTQSRSKTGCSARRIRRLLAARFRRRQCRWEARAAYSLLRRDHPMRRMTNARRCRREVQSTVRRKRPPTCRHVHTQPRSTHSVRVPNPAARDRRPSTNQEVSIRVFSKACRELARSIRGCYRRRLPQCACRVTKCRRHLCSEQRRCGSLLQTRCCTDRHVKRSADSRGISGAPRATGPSRSWSARSTSVQL